MNKQKGHEGDVERLIEEHQPQLKAFIHRRVSSKEDAEDILQDVFYQLVKAVSNTLNPIEQVTSWLYRVTRNTIINKGKKKSEEEWPVSAYAEEESVLSEFSEVLFANDDLAPSPETEYMRSLVWQELEAALGELPAEQRTVFELMELGRTFCKRGSRSDRCFCKYGAFAQTLCRQAFAQTIGRTV